MANSESAVKAVPEVGENQEDKRDRSTIEFPYLDLDAAVEVAQGIHQVGGSSCGWDQLAAQMGQAATGGGFRMRVMTAKTFGFVTYGQGTVTLTELGQRLNDPQQEKAAKADSFLKVPLYNKVYEQFKNGTLPPAEALENEIVKMGVVGSALNQAIWNVFCVTSISDVLGNSRVEKLRSLADDGNMFAEPFDVHIRNI